MHLRTHRIKSFILANEKYKGDALIQKSYVADFLDKRQRKNRGEVPQYYVSGGHKAIIAPDLFDRVQVLRKERNEGDRTFTGMNPWSNKLICGKCGTPFRNKTRHGHRCWECRDSYRKVDPCKGAFIYEEARKVLVKSLMLEVLERRTDVVRVFEEIVKRMVQDTKRQNEILAAISMMRETNCLVDDDEDLLLSFKRIVFFPDNHIEAEMIDGERISKPLKPYSPYLGWKQ